MTDNMQEEKKYFHGPRVILSDSKPEANFTFVLHSSLEFILGYLSPSFISIQFCTETTFFNHPTTDVMLFHPRTVVVRHILWLSRLAILCTLKLRCVLTVLWPRKSCPGCKTLVFKDFYGRVRNKPLCRATMLGSFTKMTSKSFTKHEDWKGSS